MTGRRVVVLIIGIEVIFCAAAAIVGGSRPYPHFLEGGLVTWVTVVQIVLLSRVALAVYRARRVSDDPPFARLWIFVAAGAVFLALDETLEIHEQVGQLLERVVALRPAARMPASDVTRAPRRR